MPNLQIVDLVVVVFLVLGKLILVEKLQLSRDLLRLFHLVLYLQQIHFEFVH